MLAEGLYALFGDASPCLSFEDQLGGATSGYWERFIAARRDVMTETRTALGRKAQDLNNGRPASAFYALGAAMDQLDCTVTADLCASFVEAWQEDRNDWQRFSNGVSNVGSTREAMDYLQLKTWTLAEFGAARVGTQGGSPAHKPDACLISNLNRRSNRPKAGRN